MRLSPRVTLIASALALSLAAGAAVAQTPPAATTAPAPAHTHMSLSERFAAANTTNDGHLTLDQARAGMPMVARHFTAMDKDSKGYVTLADVHSYLKEQRAARKQAQPDNNG